jgi:hypothetical protein
MDKLNCWRLLSDSFWWAKCSTEYGIIPQIRLGLEGLLQDFLDL